MVSDVQRHQLKVECKSSVTLNCFVDLDVYTSVFDVRQEVNDCNDGSKEVSNQRNYPDTRDRWPIDCQLTELITPACQSTTIMCLANNMSVL